MLVSRSLRKLDGAEISEYSRNWKEKLGRVGGVIFRWSLLYFDTGHWLSFLTEQILFGLILCTQISL